MKGVGATVTFDYGNDDIAVTPISEIGQETRKWVAIRATRGNHFTEASLPYKDAPAFALAVLEAAGYTADNSCAGDALRSLKFQIANEARAAEEALDKEAEALARTHWTGKPFRWSSEPSEFNNLWRAVARKARELHHVGEETSK